MAVKLHRCGWMWFKAGFHPCWVVQKALDDEGIEYELAKGPAFPRGRRKDVIDVTGQNRYPAIEFEDGTAYREESAQMAETIRAGKLREAGGGGGGGGAERAGETAPSDRGEDDGGDAGGGDAGGGDAGGGSGGGGGGSGDVGGGGGGDGGG
jgi:hypothetical protein